MALHYLRAVDEFVMRDYLRGDNRRPISDPNCLFIFYHALYNSGRIFSPSVEYPKCLAVLLHASSISRGDLTLVKGCSCKYSFPPFLDSIVSGKLHRQVSLNQPELIYSRDATLACILYRCDKLEGGLAGSARNLSRIYLDPCQYIYHTVCRGIRI